MIWTRYISFEGIGYSLYNSNWKQEDSEGNVRKEKFYNDFNLELNDNL